MPNASAAEGVRKFDHIEEGHYTQWDLGQFGTVSVYDDDGAILGSQGNDMQLPELRSALTAMTAALAAAESKKTT